MEMMQKIEDFLPIQRRRRRVDVIVVCRSHVVEDLQLGKEIFHSIEFVAQTSVAKELFPLGRREDDEGTNFTRAKEPVPVDGEGGGETHPTLGQRLVRLVQLQLAEIDVQRGGGEHASLPVVRAMVGEEGGQRGGEQFAVEEENLRVGAEVVDEQQIRTEGERGEDRHVDPVTPDSPTSLRSERVIDFALARGVNLNIQTYAGNTTSDHRPLMSVIPFSTSKKLCGHNVHWKVFSLFSEFAFSFWESNWKLSDIDSTYHDYCRFVHLLSVRCTTSFPLEKYRPSIPPELRSFLSYIRALSFRHLRTRDPVLKSEVNSLRRIAKSELANFFHSRLAMVLHRRNTTSPDARLFWSKTKRYLRNSSSSLNGFISPTGQIVKDAKTLCSIAADFYESFLKKSEIVKPHPYTDSPCPTFDNDDELIPEVSLDELLSVVNGIRKKKSSDAHGISSFMFNFLHPKYWSLLLKLINFSFHSMTLPGGWKESRMILLAKKESICLPSLTRPISLVDSFSKIGERLFLSRFRDVLFRRGLLPDNQSGFRDGFRLQTRLLLFLEDLSSLMANSAPVCTIFLDFRSAFDQIWHEGCIGKLRRLGIPPSYVRWIEAWLLNRRGFIEIQNHKSRWFSIEKGGPQGSVLTPTLFISFHCDMGQFLASSSSHLFADDVAAILSGQIGLRYTEQCLDLEKRTRFFLDSVEFYSSLTDQPLNWSKTEAMFSARAIGAPRFTVKLSSDPSKSIDWKPDFRYLGYVISSKLGWGKFLKAMTNKVRKRIALIHSFKLFGSSSPSLRKALFCSHVIPVFTWIYPIFPLLSRNQQQELSSFYFSSLRRTLSCLQWKENFFSFDLDELSLRDRCAAYWNRFLCALSDSVL